MYDVVLLGQSSEESSQTLLTHTVNPMPPASIATEPQVATQNTIFLRPCDEAIIRVRPGCVDGEALISHRSASLLFI